MVNINITYNISHKIYKLAKDNFIIYLQTLKITNTE